MHACSICSSMLINKDSTKMFCTIAIGLEKSISFNIGDGLINVVHFMEAALIVNLYYITVV